MPKRRCVMAASEESLGSAGQLAGTATMNILLAYDGSEHAEAAVELVARLTLSVDSSITLLAVMPTQYIQGHERLKARLEDTRQRLASGKARVSAEFKAGNPAASINDMAREIQTDLIVVGAKGLRATLGILLGGVAQQVVEYSCCPVLVVRAPFKEVRRVLLVTDGSPYSQSALEYLAPPPAALRPRFPLPPMAEVSVMHVLPPPITPDMMARSWTVGPEALFPVPPQTFDLEALEQREEEEGQVLLDRTVECLANAGIQATGLMPRGDAATEILEYVREQHIDLIIGGSRGLSPVTSWLLGSVSRKLVHYADCSVMVVKRRNGR
jgi:nucleotide-binding universal stress UspA family protein